MLSQKVTKRPGWNHEIAIGWRSKNIERTTNPKNSIQRANIHGPLWGYNSKCC